MNLFRKVIAVMWRQIAVILAIATYENNRRSTSSSVGTWESLLNPLQIMLFFIGLRVGFSFLFSGGGGLTSGQTGLYFNLIIFIASGFTIFFPFRQLAVKALAGLKLKAPLYYRRVEPLDILLGLSINDIRALSTITFGLLGLVWVCTWDFQMDSPGLALCVYLLTILMAIGFGVCLVFLGQFNKLITKFIKRIINRVLIFTSGLFFATFELPAFTRPFVTWNPVLHGVELFRHSLNNEYPIPGISLAYLFWCSIVLFGFSLILYRTNESLLLEVHDD